MAIKRWSGGISPVPHIILLAVVLIHLLTSGKAVGPRTNLEENVESFEDAKCAAKATDKRKLGAEVPGPTGRNANREGFQKLWDQDISSATLETIEELESIISGLEEYSNSVDGEAKVIKILRESDLDIANIILQEVESGENSMKDILDILEYYVNSLKAVVHMAETPGAYEEAIEDYTEYLKMAATPEFVDELRKDFLRADFDPEDFFGDMEFPLGPPSDDAKEVLEELMEKASSIIDRLSDNDTEERNNPREGRGMNSNQKNPQKDSAWAHKV